MKGFFKKLIKKLRHGEKGFTLIELLVVIAILGVLAAVIVPNVGKFLGAGTVEAANTEAHNVQTAVMAYMVDNSLTTCGGMVGPLAIDNIGPDPLIPGSTSVKSFITGALQAQYEILGGEIIEASVLIAVVPDGSRWADLDYVYGTGWAQP